MEVQLLYIPSALVELNRGLSNSDIPQYKFRYQNINGIS